MQKTPDMYWFTDYYNTTGQTGGFLREKIYLVTYFFKIASFYCRHLKFDIFAD